MDIAGFNRLLYIIGTSGFGLRESSRKGAFDFILAVYITVWYYKNIERLPLLLARADSPARGYYNL